MSRAFRGKTLRLKRIQKIKDYHARRDNTDVDNEWDIWSDIATFNYNARVQESTEHTLFDVGFSRLARYSSSDPLRKGDLHLRTKDVDLDVSQLVP